MSDASTFKTYCTDYFARLCHGYDYALDDTGVRAWIPGHKTKSDNLGAWDMSTRFFPALAAWLSNPERPRTLTCQGRTIDLEHLAKCVLLNAFDPEHPGFWGREEYKPRDQRTVESSMLAYGAWLLRDTLLPKLPERAIKNFQDWLTYFASGDLIEGNWNLFWIVNQSACKALGWEFKQETIDEAWKRINTREREDGWMTDGVEGAFEDYNWWVYGTHELFWLQMDGEHDSELANHMSARLTKRLEVYPHFFGRDGSYSEYGRSLSYKFARLGCPILAYKLGLWPHSAGMLKRLVRLHLSVYSDNGSISRPEGIVSQCLSEFGHPAVRDGYINTGHPYWCMHAFAALWQLSDDDPIWDMDEESLPVDKSDFRKVVKPAGWILQGNKKAGTVQRYSLGTKVGKGPKAAKYGKFMYGTHSPVNFGSVEGDFGPDAALCLTDGDHWAHPGYYETFAAHEDYLRAKYKLTVGEINVTIETILIPEGEGCLRIHQLSIPANAPQLTAWEGASCLGYQPGDAPGKRISQDPLFSFARTGGRASLIRAIEGYTRAHRPQGFRSNESLNGIYDRAITPLLEARFESNSNSATEYSLACWTEVSRIKAPDPNRIPDIKISRKSDGIVVVNIAQRSVEIPPL